MALQYVIQTYLQVPDVVAVRLGRSTQRLNTYKDATQLTLVHWTSDDAPDLHMMELPSRHITDVPKLTGHTKNKLRVMLLIQKAGIDLTIADCD